MAALSPQRTIQLTIASGQTKSNAAMLGNAPLRGLFVPAGFTGTAISFEVSLTPLDADFVPVRDATGAAITATVAAASFLGFYADSLIGAIYVRLVAGTAQGADCVLTGVYA